MKTSEQTLADEDARKAEEEIRHRVDAFARKKETSREVEAKVRLETART